MKILIGLLIAHSLVAQVVSSGLIAEYRFKNCDGTTISNTTMPDCSGNGHNATLTNHGGSGAPTPDATGLYFDGAASQTADLPSGTLSNVVTVQIMFDWQAHSEANFSGYLTGFFGSISNGFTLVGRAGTGEHRASCGVRGSGGNATVSMLYPWGPTLCTVVLDATADKIYINGTKGIGYRQFEKAGNLGTTKSGVFSFGGSVEQGEWTIGRGYYAAFYSRALLDSEVTANWDYMHSVVAARAVTFKPVNTSTHNQAVFLGDSITAYGYSAYVTPTGGTWDKTDYGYPGNTIEEVCEATDAALSKYSPSASQNTVVLFAGTNDYALESAATAHDSLKACGLKLKAAGFSVVVPLMLSRMSGADTWKNQYNTLIQAHWSEYANALATPPTQLLADGAYANTTYFGDGIHPTDLGNQLLGAAVQTAIDGAGHTVYLRDGPGGYQIIGISSGVFQTLNQHGLIVGDKIENHNICANDSTRRYISNYNTVGYVATVPDTTHFTMEDLSHSPIAESSAWCGGGNALSGYTTLTQWGGKVTDYTVSDVRTKGVFDGATGRNFRKTALSTDNGLVSAVKSGSSLTVSLGFSPEISVGDKVSIHGSTGGTLNGEFLVASVGSNSYVLTLTGGAALVTNGDWTHNDHCGPSVADPNVIGGTDNCLVLSQRANSDLGLWQKIVDNTNSYISTPFGHLFDGGPTKSGGWGNASFCAIRTVIDRDFQPAVDCGVTFLSKFERLFGINFFQNEQYDAYQDIFTAISTDMFGMGMVAQQFVPYLTTQQLSDFREKILNDNDTLCRIQQTTRPTLATGVAQAGSSNSITIAAGDSQSNGYYVGDIVEVTHAGSVYYGYITAYASKVATISTPDAGYYNTWITPSSGDTYTIYPSVTLSGTTLTGHHTRFTTDLSVGDGVFGSSPYPDYAGRGNNTSPYSALYVSARASDTTATIIVDDDHSNFGSIPQIPIYVPKWSSGDCGLYHFMNYWWGSLHIGIAYPRMGFEYNGVPVHYDANQIWIEAAGYINISLALASDARARQTIEKFQSFTWNWALPWNWMYNTAFANLESVHYWVHGGLHPSFEELLLKNTFTGFPDMGPQERQKNINRYHMYMSLPDDRTPALGGSNWMWNYGYNAGQAEANGNVMGTDMLSQWQSDPTSAYLKDFAARHSLTPQPTNDYQNIDSFLFSDPAIHASDHTAQPKQFAFTQTGRDKCLSLANPVFDFGAGCPATVSAGAVLSLSDWGVNDRSATSVFFQNRTFVNEYDGTQGGELGIYKSGYLVGDNNRFVFEMQDNNNVVEHADLPQLGNSWTINPGSATPASAYVDRWAGTNSGSWDAHYGDAQSRYMYARSDLSGMWATPTPTRAKKEVVHFKKSGTREVVIERNDYAVSSSMPLIRHFHFTQNGEANDQSVYLSSLAGYPEGNTSCVSCSGTNPTGYVYSHESGAAQDSIGPARKAGLMASFFSPLGITVRDDGSWAADNPNYNAANPSSVAYTHRVSVSMGTTFGASGTTMDLIGVYEITPDFTVNNTATATALNPDSNWTGVQTVDKVALFARGGTLKTGATFTSTHSGTAQYILAGMASGTYDVTVSGTPVTGSPFTVADGDNTIYFESTAGSILVGAGSPPPPPPPGTGGSVTRGNVGVHGKVVIR